MGIKSILTLLGIAGIAGSAYFYRDGIKEAFGDAKDTASGLKDDLQRGSGGGSSGSTSETTTVTEVTPLPDDANSKTGGKGQSTTQIIFVPINQNQGTSSISPKDNSNRGKYNPTFSDFVKSSKRKTSRVVNHGFSTRQERENPREFEKRKFGIDNDLLEKAVSKSTSKRSITERKQIEAERARAVFDSRDISNF